MTAEGDGTAVRPGGNGARHAAGPPGPGISVLVPVRNGMPHLTAQLEALSRQTYQGRWEIIVSDNGSTDDSVRAIRAARTRVPLRIVDSREAAGRAGALAVAARAASGQLLLFCDADDIVADDWVERMKVALGHWPAVGGYLDEESLNPPAVLAWRPRATPGELPCPFGLLPRLSGRTAGCGGMPTRRSAASISPSVVPRRRRPTCSGGFSWPVTSSAMRRTRSWPTGTGPTCAHSEAMAWLRPGPRAPAGPLPGAGAVARGVVAGRGQDLTVAGRALGRLRPRSGPPRGVPADPGPCGRRGGGQPGIRVLHIRRGSPPPGTVTRPPGTAGDMVRAAAG